MKKAVSILINLAAGALTIMLCLLFAAAVSVKELLW